MQETLKEIGEAEIKQMLKDITFQQVFTIKNVF